MTSEVIGLGESDANARWIGVRRHQALLLIAGLGLLGDWVLVPHAKLEILIAGVVAFSCAVPLRDGLTGGELAVVALRYALRARWSLVTTQMNGADVRLEARGNVVVRGFELLHRGRLDLSGADGEISRKFVELLRGMATTNEVGHASIHVRSVPEAATTLMTLRAGASTPEGWQENGGLLQEFVGLAANMDCVGLLERWSYVRSEEGVMRTFRVSDFSGAPAQRALLERLQQCSRRPEISLHVQVISNTKAHRVASRAVHQSSSDGAASSSVGFRRSAQSKRSLHRLAQREEFVAEGEALLRLAVFVTVRAQSRRSLRASSNDVIQSAQESGLRLHRGSGRQILWHCFQLPGGPGW